MTAPSEQTVPLKCLQCQCDMETPIVCSGCDTLFPVPEALDYYALFSLPRRYRVDLEELDRKFLSITRNIHPDFFSGRSEEMRELSVRLTAELNEALRVLRDPVFRAGYLLELAGGPSAARDREVPQSVLMEAMELREEIEEANRDSGTLSEIRERVTARRSEILDRVADLADAIDAADREKQVELRKLLNSVKYYDNLLADLPVG